MTSVTWTAAGEYSDIRYETSGDGIAKITIDRPEVRNAFRPQTLIEISDALTSARDDLDIGVIILTGEGPDAFCAGAALLARQIGAKRAREVWYLCRQYDAATALQWGLVNAVVPLDRLEEETVAWCREMLALSPFALRLLKASFNAAEDGFAGLQQLAHDTNLLFYGSEEAQEGRDAYVQKRAPDFSKFPRRP